LRLNCAFVSVILGKLLLFIEINSTLTIIKAEQEGKGLLYCLFVFNAIDFLRYRILPSCVNTTD